MQSEQILGVVWAIEWARGFPAGYAMIFTNTRAVGSKKMPMVHYCLAYLGPGSKATDDERNYALKTASELMADKQFEFPKESIVKVSYRAPGLFSRGHVIFQTVSETIELKIASKREGGVIRLLRTLIPSLVAFAEDRVWDEKTGTLLGQEILKTHKLPI